MNPFVVNERVRITARHYLYVGCEGSVVEVLPGDRYRVYDGERYLGIYPAFAIERVSDTPVRTNEAPAKSDIAISRDKAGELRITVDGVEWAPTRHGVVMGVSGVVGFTGPESPLAVAAAQLVREVDLMLAGGELMMQPAEKCTECGLGGEGPVKDALQAIRPLLGASRVAGKTAGSTQ